MVELFRARLEALDGRLHEAPTLDAAREIAAAVVGDAPAARWADAALDGIARRQAPAQEAEVSLVVADAGVAASGAIALVHGAGRPRAAGVLPARQVALLRRADLVADLDAAVARVLADAGGPPPASVVFVGGPSRTADIEQRTIRGAQGPRELDVVLYG